MISVEYMQKTLGLSPKFIEKKKICVSGPALKEVISEFIRCSGINEGVYLAMYPDVVAWISAVEGRQVIDHYTQLGFYEGRGVVSADFNELEYLRLHPDVKEALENGIYKTPGEHYIKYGIKENRKWK